MRSLYLTLLSIVCFSSQAGLITHANFAETLAIPFVQDFDLEPRNFTALNRTVSDSSTELTESHESSNPSGLEGHADMDLTKSGLLTLTGRQPDEFADYQTALFSLSNIQFDMPDMFIAGVNIIGTGSELFTVGGIYEIPLPQIIFDDTSVEIYYQVGDAQSNTDDLFELGDGLSAQFQLILQQRDDDDPSRPIPAPMSVLFYLIGLVLLSRGFKR